MKTSEETRSCWFSPLWMWLWGANSWAHSSDVPTPGDSTPTVLARRHWSGHQALGASCRTTADGRLPSSQRPQDLAWSSHRTQKKKKKYPTQTWRRNKSKYTLQRGISLDRLQTSRQHRGFPTRMVHLHYISCLRYTILVGNPRYASSVIYVHLKHDMCHFSQT